jgi:glycosyltransferase involved in cell wall biosynthesis
MTTTPTKTDKPLNILLVHQYFLDAGGAGGARWNEMTRFWAEAGHNVTVLSGMVDYNTGRKVEKYRWRFIVKEQISDNVTLYRCHVSQKYNKSFFGRAWAYFSFAFSSTVAGILKVKRPDVILATSPPLTVSSTMNWLGWIFRRPTIFEVRDLWPESAIDTGVLQPGRLANILYKMEAKAYKRSKWINVLTPAFRDKLINNKGIDGDKISMIPNGADPGFFEPGDRNNDVRKELNLGDKFVVGYFGAHGRANHLAQLLDVAAKLKDTQPDIQLMLVGAGMEKEELVARAKAENLDNVTFVPPVPKEEVSRYVNACDVCTAVLLKNDTFKTVYPNKVFDYMCCARPIIIGIDGVARELVENAKAGIFAEPQNADAFIDAVMKLKNSPDLAAQMAASGRTYVLEHFTREKLAAQYLEVVKKVAAGA